VLDTSLGLITPYLAFIPAQFLHGSGILAVVVAGLFLGYRSPTIQTAEARIAETINWRTISFLLENAVFLFIGLELAGIAKGAFNSGITAARTIVASIVVLLALFVARFIWMVLTTALYRYGPQRLRERGWNWATGIAVSFAGIRGVVTLAAVFLLPPQTPDREFLQFLAFIVVVGTLLEGLALPWVIRRLKLPPPDFQQESSEMQRLLAEAQTAGLAKLEQEVTGDEDERVVERLRINAVFLADALENPTPPDGEDAAIAYQRLRRSMIKAERAAVLDARSEGRYQELAVRSVLAFLDAEESALKSSGPKKPMA
jgi:CPA1 family monovalent cation:H+ antiporter